MECQLVDVHGVTWSIVDKIPVVTNELLDEHSTYPRATSIACEVVHRSRASDGCEVVRIDTARPWGIEATDGQTVFDVSADLVTDE